MQILKNKDMKEIENIEQSSVKSRLIEFLKFKNISQAEFEKICQLSNGYVNNIRKSIKSEKFDDNITPNFPELNKFWLLFGEGEMLGEEEFKNIETISSEPITGYYLPDVSAAAGLEKSMYNDELKRIPVTIPGWESDIIFINVFGDSMYPIFASGQIIGVKEVDFQYINYGYAYVVVLTDGEVFLKYLKKGKDDSHIILASENQFYEPKEFKITMIKKVFIIKGTISKTTF